MYHVSGLAYFTCIPPVKYVTDVSIIYTVGTSAMGGGGLMKLRREFCLVSLPAQL